MPSGGQKDDDSGKYGYALMNAIMNDETDIASNLLDAGASLDWQTIKDGNGPLHHAVIHHNPKLIAILLKHGADISKKNDNGKTAIELASEKKWWKCVNAFADNKSDKNGDGNYGAALLGAVQDNQLDTVSKLLSANASVAWQTIKDGNGPLHLAVANGNLNMLVMLLNHDADCKKTNLKGNTPLHCAVIFNKPGLITLLLKHGADVSQWNNDGKTAVQLASDMHHSECVDAFFQYKKNLTEEAASLSGNVSSIWKKGDNTFSVTPPKTDIEIAHKTPKKSA